MLIVLMKARARRVAFEGVRTLLMKNYDVHEISLLVVQATS